MKLYFFSATHDDDAETDLSWFVWAETPKQAEELYLKNLSEAWDTEWLPANCCLREVPATPPAKAELVEWGDMVVIWG